MKKVKCSFCKEGVAKTQQLIEGPPIRINCSSKEGEQFGEINIVPYICNDCVDLCKKLLLESTKTSKPKEFTETKELDS